MSDVAKLFDLALRRANVPILGVSIRDEADRATWRIDYARGATELERATGEALRLAFDPASPQLRDVVERAEAAALANSRTIRAFYLFWFRQTTGRDPTAEERDADEAALIQAWRDTPAGP
jgi:hypothetical protein